MKNLKKIVQILKKFFKMSIFAYYFQIIFLTNYVSGKIEWHVPPQSTGAKNWGGGTCPKGSSELLWLSPPPRFQRLTSPMDRPPHTSSSLEKLIRNGRPLADSALPVITRNLSKAAALWELFNALIPVLE